MSKKIILFVSLALTIIFTVLTVVFYNKLSTPKICYDPVNAQYELENDGIPTRVVLKTRVEHSPFFRFEKGDKRYSYYAFYHSGNSDEDSGFVILCADESDSQFSMTWENIYTDNAGRMSDVESYGYSDFQGFEISGCLSDKRLLLPETTDKLFKSSFDRKKFDWSHNPDNRKFIPEDKASADVGELVIMVGTACPEPVKPDTTVIIVFMILSVVFALISLISFIFVFLEHKRSRK